MGAGLAAAGAGGPLAKRFDDCLGPVLPEAARSSCARCVYVEKQAGSEVDEAHNSRASEEAAEAARERRRSSVAVLGYQGEWHEGRKHGKGKFTYPNKDKYEGEWQDDKAFGHGIFETDSSTYDGQWMNDLKHGSGIEKFIDGTVYEGSFSQGHRHGHGLLTWADGSFYDGQFVCNNQEGSGTLSWKNNHKYTGEVLDNLIHGHGKYEWPDGSLYEGQYKMGLKDGEGLFISKSAHEMKCQWRDGRPIGRVTFRQMKLVKDIVPPVLDWYEGVMVTWGARSEDGTPRTKEGATGGRAEFISSGRQSAFTTPRSAGDHSSRAKK